MKTLPDCYHNNYFPPNSKTWVYLGLDAQSSKGSLPGDQEVKLFADLRN
jgi:hypothetical protein